MHQTYIASISHVVLHAIMFGPVHSLTDAQLYYEFQIKQR